MGVTGGRCNIHDRNGAIYGRGSHIVACVYARATWLTLMCDMTHPYGWDKTHLCVWYHLFIYLRGCDIHGRNGAVCGRGSHGVAHIYARATWLANMSVTRLICMCDMTHSYVWHDSFLHIARYDIQWRRMWAGKPWRGLYLRTCDMTHSYICMCDMTHSYI